MTEKEVRQFIVDNFLFGQDSGFSPDDSLLEVGIIDSTGVLELVSFIEEQAGFTVEQEELVPENFDSINRIVCYVSSKRAAASA